MAHHCQFFSTFSQLLHFWSAKSRVPIAPPPLIVPDLKHNLLTQSVYRYEEFKRVIVASREGMKDEYDGLGNRPLRPPQAPSRPQSPLHDTPPPSRRVTHVPRRITRSFNQTELAQSYYFRRDAHPNFVPFFKLNHPKSLRRQDMTTAVSSSTHDLSIIIIIIIYMSIISIS